MTQIPSSTSTRISALAICLFALPATLRANDSPIQVFIFAGQSNMVGYGRTEAEPSNNNGEAGTLRGMVNGNPTVFAFGGSNPLVDSAGNWRVRSDVNVYAYDHNSGNPIIESGGHTPGFGINTWNGPEYGFGQIVGNALEEDVLIIKVANGGTSLGVNWRSPSAVANRGGSIGDMWLIMATRVNTVLTNLETQFPEYEGRPYEIAGFGWHQGWNDGSSVALHTEYEANLVDLIADVRSAFGVGMPVMIANTGMLNFPSLAIARPNVLNAQNNVGDPIRHPLLVGNVAVVNTIPLWRPPAQSPADQVFHWHQNGITMYEIGAGMANAYLSLGPVQPACGDHDEDGDVDVFDFDEAFAPCMSGPAGLLPDECFDLEFVDCDQDEDADIADFATFSANFNGASA